MTELDRLADVVARMTEAPWQAVKDEDDFHEEADYWGISTECRFPLADMRESCDPEVRKVHPKNNAAGIAALRNVADALIDVALAARTAYPNVMHSIACYYRIGPKCSCGAYALRDALAELDTAITKALGEGT